jgi:hypothetical protein
MPGRFLPSGGSRDATAEGAVLTYLDKEPVSPGAQHGSASAAVGAVAPGRVGMGLPRTGNPVATGDRSVGFVTTARRRYARGFRRAGFVQAQISPMRQSPPPTRAQPRWRPVEPAGAGGCPRHTSLCWPTWLSASRCLRSRDPTFAAIGCRRGQRRSSHHPRRSPGGSARSGARGATRAPTRHVAWARPNPGRLLRPLAAGLGRPFWYGLMQPLEGMVLVTADDLVVQDGGTRPADRPRRAGLSSVTQQSCTSACWWLPTPPGPADHGGSR